MNCQRRGKKKILCATEVSTHVPQSLGFKIQSMKCAIFVSCPTFYANLPTRFRNSIWNQNSLFSTISDNLLLWNLQIKKKLNSWYINAEYILYNLYKKTVSMTIYMFVPNIYLTCSKALSPASFPIFIRSSKTPFFICCIQHKQWTNNGWLGTWPMGMKICSS